MKSLKIFVSLIALCAAPIYAEQTVLKVGYFPNVTHAQGVIGAYTTQSGEGVFEKEMGKDVKIQWVAYNAGPSAMEALLGGNIDLTFVGPGPAITFFVGAKESNVKILSGATVGGAALLVRKGLQISDASGFKGKRIATPQFGNTQDIACRAWLQRNNFDVQAGKDVTILPIKNPDQVTLMQKGEIDAAWTVEPWVSNLEQNFGASVFLEQRDVPTTIIVTSQKILDTKKELLKKFLEAHKKVIMWMQSNPKQAKEFVYKGISRQTSTDCSPALVENAWLRLKFSDELNWNKLTRIYDDAVYVGIMRSGIELKPMLSDLCKMAN